MFFMALLGALIGVQDVVTLQDELDQAAGFEVLANSEPLAPEASIAAGLWQALVASAAGIGVALWGYFLVRQRESRA